MDDGIEMVSLLENSGVGGGVWGNVRVVLLLKGWFVGLKCKDTGKVWNGGHIGFA